MAQDLKDMKAPYNLRKRQLITSAVILMLLFVLVVITVIVAQSGASKFITRNQNYILSLEIIFLVVFFIETLARVMTIRLKRSDISVYSFSLRLIIRVIGYTIGLLSVIAILASNTALGVSVGAIAGVIIAFATQNIASNVLAAIVIITTHMIRIGEEITVGGTKGTVANISLIHTVLSVDEDVVFIPNSAVIASQVRRRKRLFGSVDVSDW